MERPWVKWLSIAYVVAMPILISLILGWRDVPASLKFLGGQTAAAWLQAIGSLMALGVAIYVPARERRLAELRANAARLTFRTMPAHVASGMEVEIAYLPVSRHQSFVAIVEVLSSTNYVALSGLRRVVTGADGLEIIRQEVDSFVAAHRQRITMANVSIDQPEGAVFGVVHLYPPDAAAWNGKRRAEIDVTIIATGDETVVAKRRVWVSVSN